MFLLQVEENRPILVKASEKSKRTRHDHQQPVRARLPWFRCRKCQARLAPMDIVDGRTCVRVSPYAISYKIEITCERCGTMREFVSMAAL